MGSPHGSMRFFHKTDHGVTARVKVHIGWVDLTAVRNAVSRCEMNRRRRTAPILPVMGMRMSFGPQLRAGQVFSECRTAPESETTADRPFWGCMPCRAPLIVC